jgi:hypothetical protein
MHHASRATVPTEPLAPAERESASRSIEWKILLAAGAANPCESDLARVGELISGEGEDCSVHWNALLRLAEFHGMSPLLFRNLDRLNRRVPVLEALRRQHESNVRKSLFLARELVRILDCANSLGVEVVPYKGVVLAEVYYGDLALRPAGDVDLFIRRRDVARFKNALADLGYKPNNPLPEAAEEAYLNYGYECGFDSPAGNNLLELQWALEPHYYSVDFDMEGLFERAVPVDFAGGRVAVPSPEDLLLVLSLHAAKHVWGRLIWLCDIRQILDRNNLNWDRVRSQCAELRVERILHVTLLLANGLLGIRIPAPVESAVANDRGAADLYGQILASMIAGLSYEEQKISYFRLMMRLRERPMDRLRFLSRLALDPGPGEWQAIRLPKSLFPLYRLVRLWRLGARIARG